MRAAAARVTPSLPTADMRFDTGRVCEQTRGRLDERDNPRRHLYEWAQRPAWSRLRPARSISCRALALPHGRVLWERAASSTACSSGAAST